MRRTIIRCFAILTLAAPAFGQSTARQYPIILDENKTASIVLTHKANSAITFNGVVTNSETGPINIAGKTGTLGFKESLSATTFFAEASVTVTNDASGRWSANFTSDNFATNITRKTRYFGDLRLANFGNMLPSIDLYLKPSANQGTESSYVSPVSAGFETNSVLIELLNRINFTSGFVLTYSQDGNTNKLTISVPPGAVGEFTGSGTTGTVTSAVGDIARFLRGDGTWADPMCGSTNITIVGTVTQGVWNGTVIVAAYLPTDLVYTNNGDFTSNSLHRALLNNPHAVTKTQVGLSAVENTALSTWAGSTNVVILGVVTSATWNGTAVGEAYIDPAIARDSEVDAKTNAMPAFDGDNNWTGNSNMFTTVYVDFLVLRSATGTNITMWAGDEFVNGSNTVQFLQDGSSVTGIIYLPF